VAVDPTNGDVAYAGGWWFFYPSQRVFGIYRTTDGGKSWAQWALRSEGVNDIAIDPTDPRTVYAATWFGVFKTTDGENWFPASQGIGDALTTAIAIDPIDPQVLYVTAYSRGGEINGVYKSVDGAQTWTFSGLGQFDGVDLLEMDPVHHQTLYAHVLLQYPGQAIYRSTDGGVSWKQTGVPGHRVSSFAIDEAHSGTLYTGTDDGVFRTTDRGATWALVGPAGMWARYVTGVAVSPDGRTVYAATNEGGVFIYRYP
jgi:photosystem II stability/assembly factor-like uncharacterized protein